VIADGATVATPSTGGAVLPAPALGVSRTYTVVAVDAWGQTGPAATTTVTGGDPHGVPDAATFGPLTPSNGAVTVRWNAPASDGGGAVTDYRLRVYEDGDLFRETFVGTALSSQVTGLSNGTAYTFQIAAANAVGYGPTTTSGPVTPGTVPTAPAVGVPITGAASAVVRWAVPTSNGGLPITGYLARAYRGTQLVRTAAAGPGATSVTMSGLTNGLAYTFIVTASNALGSSVGSGRSVAVTPLDRPGAPRMGSASPADGGVIVRWSPPVSNGGSAIRAYVVRTYRGTTLVKQTNVSAATTRVLVNGLTNGLGYTFSVTALNGVGWGGRSSMVLVVPRR